MVMGRYPPLRVHPAKEKIPLQESFEDSGVPGVLPFPILGVAFLPD